MLWKLKNAVGVLLCASVVVVTGWTLIEKVIRWAYGRPITITDLAVSGLFIASTVLSILVVIGDWEKKPTQP